MPLDAERLRNTIPAILSDSALSVGYEELFPGRRTTIRRIKRRMSLYTLGQALDMIGRISTVLSVHSNTPFIDLEHLARLGPNRWIEIPQLNIAGSLFGQDMLDLGFRCINWRLEFPPNETGNRIALFDQVQLISASKLAILWLQSQKPEEELHTDFRQFGEALLMISNLNYRQLEWHKPEWEELPFDERALAYERHSLVESQVRLRQPLLNTFSRSFALYLTHRRRLAEMSGHTNLRKRFERGAGMSAKDFYAGVYGIQSHYLSYKLEHLRTRTSALAIPTFFDAVLEASQIASETFFSLLSSDLDSFRHDLSRQGISADNLQPYNVYTFAKKPFLAVNERAYCTSVPLLLDKLGNGLHHFHLDKERFPEKKDRGKYLAYIGHTFEDYVHSHLRAIAKEVGGILRRPEVSPKFFSTRPCDFILVSNNTCFLFECKASRFRLQFKTTPAVVDPEGFDDTLRKIYMEAAHQLHDTAMKLIAATSCREIGLSTVPKRFVPIIVTLENTPPHPAYIQTRIDSHADDNGFLEHQSITKSQIIDVTEVELLTALAVQKRQPLDLLEHRADVEEVRYRPLINYCQAQGLRFNSDDETEVNCRYHSLMKRILRHFEDRMRVDNADSSSGL